MRENCRKISVLKIESWSDGRPFQQQIGAAKASLFNEIDNIDIEAAQTLAKLYIFFGFGSEAIDVLESTSQKTEEFQSLISIAKLIDGRKNITIENVDCLESGPLWAALSEEQSSSALTASSKRILAQLSTLPIHLRRILAPRLNKKFLEQGEIESATLAMQTLKRSDTPLSEPALYQNSLLSVSSDQSELSLEKLSEITSNTLTSAEALVEKISFQLAQGIAIDENDHALIDSYSIEFRKTAFGDKINQTKVLMLTASHDFKSAFEKFDRLKPEQKASLKPNLFQTFSESSADTKFASKILSESDWGFLTNDPEIAVKISERLMDLGFFKKAEEILNETNVSSDNGNILRAEIFIEMKDLAAAENYLQVSDNTQSAEVLAHIRERQKRHEEAAEIYGEIGEQRNQRRNAILSFDKSSSTGKFSSLLPGIFNVSNADVSTPNIEPGSLGEIREMLEESRASRDALAGFINEQNLESE